MQEEWRIAPENDDLLIENWPFILQFEVPSFEPLTNQVKSHVNHMWDSLSIGWFHLIGHLIAYPTLTCDLMGTLGGVFGCLIFW